MLGKTLLISFLLAASSIRIQKFDEPSYNVHGDFPADAKDAPPFFVKSEWVRDDFMPAINTHPSRVTDEANATFVVVGPKFNCKPGAFSNLPKLAEGKSYLIWTNSLHSKCMNAGITAMTNRPDFMFVALDLRNHDLKHNDAKQLHGITMSPPYFHAGKTADPSIPAKYHLTYRGQLRHGWDGSSSVRPDLAKAFEAYHSETRPRQDIYVEFLPRNTAGNQQNRYSQADKDKFQELTNTNFFLNPHGDNRYMNGFATTLGSCAVPVVMADGLTLPFGELIDWSKAAVFMPEKVAKEGAEAVLAALPQDPKTIQAMRTEACTIYDKYFSSIERRIDAMLKSAAIRMTKKENAKDYYTTSK